MRRTWITLAAMLAALATGQCQKDKSEDKTDKAAKQAKPAAEGAARPKRVRPATKAGSWYPADPKALAAEVDQLFEKATPPEQPVNGPIRALIVPHAGYAFSGVTAASGYKLVADRTFQRVIVLATSHAGLQGMSIADVTHYRTPLGDVPLDLTAVAALRADRLVRSVARAHKNEHSIEIQLPLMQRALRPGWKLVPILVGQMDPDDLAHAAELIRPFADGKTLIVASGDFTHYGDNYDYHPFPEGADVAKSLRELDMGAFKLIAARDADGFRKYREKTGITVCGFYPFSLLIHLLGDKSHVSLVKYATSGQLTGDYSSSVSYFALAFTSDEPLASQQLSEAEMKTLHALACRALDRAVRKGPDAVDADELAAGLDLTDHLRKDSGAFVTLKEHGDLRGCIGHISAVEALYEAVVDNAVNAALRDHRFEPVTADELDSLEVEVSVLSPLRPIPTYEEFSVGEQGIVLSKGNHRAVYLPEVATEQGWNRAETLSYLSRKAGLPTDAWREGASFSVFTSQKYTAPFRAP